MGGKNWSHKPKLIARSTIPGTLVFMVSYLWFYFPGEYVQIANRDLSLFFWTTDYLHSFLDRPGGLLEYVGSFLNQFYRFRLAGAVILSLLIISVYILTGRLVARISGRKDLYVIAFITAVLLLGMHNYYPHQTGQSLGFILASGLALLLPSPGKRRRVFLVISIPVFYFMAGGFIWMYCGLILAAYLVGEKATDIPSMLLSTLYPAALIALSATLVFLKPFQEQAVSPLPFGAAYGHSIWPYVYIFWILLWVVLLRLPLRIPESARLWAMLARAIACILAFILVLHFSYNRKNQELFQIEKRALDQDWDELLAYTAVHPSSNLFGSFYTNLALARQGQLCSGLFQYPQFFGRNGLCFNWDARGEILRRGSDFFWTINFVNEAHHWAFESMIVDGFTRRNLTRLIQTELVRGNYRVAEKYVVHLGRAMFHRKIALHYARLLNDRNALASDPEIGPRIRYRMEEDFFAEGMDLEVNLQSLLANNPSNIQAWDYLMALFLLEKQVDKIAAALPAYLEASGGRMPRLLDESLLVYRITHREEDQSRLAVSPNTLQRFDAYTRILRQYRDQNEAARVLHPNYGTTFWFYLNFVSLPNP